MRVHTSRVAALRAHRFGNDVKVVHFIGASKPWHLSYNTATGDVSAAGGVDPSQQRFLQLWWDIFMQDVQSTLHSDLVSAVRKTGSEIGANNWRCRCKNFSLV